MSLSFQTSKFKLSHNSPATGGGGRRGALLLLQLVVLLLGGLDLLGHDPRVLLSW